MNNQSKQSTLKDFQILKKIGQGAYGIIYKVKRNTDQKIYVLKQINTQHLSFQFKKKYINEAILLNQMHSQHIVQYYDSFLEQNSLIIIMEYCEGGDLENYIKNQCGQVINESKIWQFFFQISKGIYELHKRKVLHRDIKTMNIFLTLNQEIRIGDLGIAKQLQENHTHAHTQVGTPYYMSPEVVQDIPYNEKSDIWALGCVLYQLATFKRPFEAQNYTQLMIKIQKEQYKPISSIYSKLLSQVIDKCLTKDHNKRPNIIDLLQDSEIQIKSKQVNVDISCFSLKGQYSTEKQLNVLSPNKKLPDINGKEENKQEKSAFKTTNLSQNKIRQIKKNQKIEEISTSGLENDIKRKFIEDKKYQTFCNSRQRKLRFSKANIFIKQLDLKKSSIYQFNISKNILSPQNNNLFESQDQSTNNMINMPDNIKTNPQLYKLYQQKYEHQLQSKQMEQRCINLLGFEKYEGILQELRQYLDGEQELSKQNQKAVLNLFEEQLKNQNDCISKFYNIIQNEIFLKEIQNKINEIEK